MEAHISVPRQAEQINTVEIYTDLPRTRELYVALRPEQKHILTRALTEGHATERLSADIPLVSNDLANVATPQSIVFEELCAAEINQNSTPHRRVLYPSETARLCHDIATRLGMQRLPIDPDGFMVDIADDIAIFRGIFESTLSNELEAEKTDQIQRYLDSNGELEFLKYPETSAAFKDFMRKMNYARHFTMGDRQIRTTLMLTYLANPDRSFDGVETHYSSFTSVAVGAVTEALQADVEKMRP